MLRSPGALSPEGESMPANRFHFGHGMQGKRKGIRLYIANRILWKALSIKSPAKPGGENTIKSGRERKGKDSHEKWDDHSAGGALCALGIGAWGENLPVEEAEEAAYHLMIGDFGYRPEEAAGFRYEGWMEEGSISTYVRVYTDSGQEAYIELCYWNDGTLDEARIDINVPFEYWKRKITEEEAKESARHLLMGKYGYGEDVMEGFRYEAQEQEGIIVVRVYPFEEMEDEYFTLKYHYDGRLSSDEIPDILDFSAYTKEVQETGVPIQFYTHEQRAAYSQIYIPKVEAARRLNPARQK